MHRDIKLLNLALKSLVPPHDILIDFDSAIIAPASKDHKQGTLEYLAPEIVALKHYRSPAPTPPLYGHAIDIWALGLCMFALHLNAHFDLRSLAGLTAQERFVITHPAYVKFRQIMDDRQQQLTDATEIFLLGAVRRMIEWESSRRIVSRDLSALVQRYLKLVGPSAIQPKDG